MRTGFPYVRSAGRHTVDAARCGRRTYEHTTTIRPPLVAGRLYVLQLQGELMDSRTGRGLTVCGEKKINFLAPAAVTLSQLEVAHATSDGLSNRAFQYGQAPWKEAFAQSTH